MLKFFHLLSAAIIFASVGCQHNRVTSTADVSVVGGCIETRNRYRPVCKDYWCGVAIGANELKPYQPNVFAADGIPFTINASSGVFESAWGWTGILCAMTIGALPWIETRHYHTTYTLSFEDKNIPIKSFETCTRRGKAFAWLPLPLLFFNFVPELTRDSSSDNKSSISIPRLAAMSSRSQGRMLMAEVSSATLLGTELELVPRVPAVSATMF